MTSPKTSDLCDKTLFCLKAVGQNYNGTAALSGIDLGVRVGEAVALVGPSGAGKTTLLRCLNGTLRPTSGAVKVREQNLGELTTKELRGVRAKIGFIHQDLSLVPNLRVSQNVMAGRLGRMTFFSSLRSMFFPPRADLERVHKILERVGIGEKLFHRTDTLSGGQKQRVAIARALFQDPEALLADEPVSSVDPARAEDTVRLLTEISKEQGLTLLMSIHNRDLARRYFPRLVGMRKGKVAFDQPVEEVDDDAFNKLYDLGNGEMMQDGA